MRLKDRVGVQLEKEFSAIKKIMWGGVIFSI